MPLCQTLSEFYPPKPRFTEDDLPDLSGKVYLITGGTSGIGLALAKILYSKNAKVYITSRSDRSAEQAITGIQKSVESTKGELKYLLVDLSDISTVGPMVQKFLEQENVLHIVWFNAGVMNVPDGSITKQNFELQWGTNVVAHFIMNKLLTPVLLSTAQAAPKGTVRVVWVSSDGHILLSPKGDGIDWNDITTKKGPGWTGDKGSMTYYGQSKVGNVLLAKEIAKRYGGQGIVSVALNPGHLQTNLQRHTNHVGAKVFSKLLLHDPYLGSLTELFAGFSESIGLENNGAYIIPWGRLGRSRADIESGFYDRGTGKKLWDILEEQTKEYI